MAKKKRVAGHESEPNSMLARGQKKKERGQKETLKQQKQKNRKDKPSPKQNHAVHMFTALDVSSQSSSQTPECGFCMTSATALVMLPCSHQVCCQCFSKCSTTISAGRPSCLVCMDSSGKSDYATNTLQTGDKNCSNSRQGGGLGALSSAALSKHTNRTDDSDRSLAMHLGSRIDLTVLTLDGQVVALSVLPHITILQVSVQKGPYHYGL
jgi:hypothetical protein